MSGLVGSMGVMGQVEEGMGSGKEGIERCRLQLQPWPWPWHSEHSRL